jgi:hypothetical protein
MNFVDEAILIFSEMRLQHLDIYVSHEKARLLVGSHGEYLRNSMIYEAVSTQIKCQLIMAIFNVYDDVTHIPKRKMQLPRRNTSREVIGPILRNIVVCSRGAR